MALKHRLCITALEKQKRHVHWAVSAKQQVKDPTEEKEKGNINPPGRKYKHISEETRSST